MKFVILAISLIFNLTATTSMADDGLNYPCYFFNKHNKCVKSGGGTSVYNVSFHLAKSPYYTSGFKISDGNIYNCIRDNATVHFDELEHMEAEHRAFVLTEILATNHCVEATNLSALEADVLKSFGESK